MYMDTAWFWIILLLIIGIDFYVSIGFSQIPPEKGYEDGGKWMAIAFLCGLFGKMYIMALPDRTVKELLKDNNDLLKKIKMETQDIDVDELPELNTSLQTTRMTQDIDVDELPDL